MSDKTGLISDTTSFIDKNTNDCITNEVIDGLIDNGFGEG